MVRRAQTLLADNAKMSQAALFLQSQEGLPRERHRASSTNARAWLRAQLKGAGPLPSPVKIWRP